MACIDTLPSELLAQVFGYEGLGDIARQVCRRWRQVALPLWWRRLPLLPSDPFKDMGLLQHIQQWTLDERLFIRALDITSRREFDSGNVFYSDAADEACVVNVLQIQLLLGTRIKELTMTDTGWLPESLVRILETSLVSTDHLHHFQLALYRAESFAVPWLMDALETLLERDATRLRSLVLDLAQPLRPGAWEAISHSTDLQHFHLGIHRSSEPILTDILLRVLPQWTDLTSLYLCQPRFLSPETLACLYTHLPRPDRLRELRLIFEACQASLYEEEFLLMIRAMPKLQVLEAHMDWTNHMMKQVATSLVHLQEISITCSGSHLTCLGIRHIAWGPSFEKLTVRTSGRIWDGFLDAVRKRSLNVKILVYGAMKWGGSVDEWE